MASHRLPPTPDNRILVKLRPTASLAAAESRANLRPLHEPSAAAFQLAGEPRWYLAELPDGADNPWDMAHQRVADQLGVAESDVLFAEPDLVHDIFRESPDPGKEVPAQRFALAADCQGEVPQESKNRKATGPDRFAWHLEDEFSQLRRARDQVEFTDPRTRIGHIDTGYIGDHITLPARLRRDLQQNFVTRDGDPHSAEDPNNKVFLMDNSGHGTGTLGILAGAAAPRYGPDPLGGAPEAEVVPLRVADRVVLLRTSSFARALEYAVRHGCDVVSMSMGGLPMRSWREEVDRAYLAGVCVVSAAGNNFARLPTRHLVYPARYGRVIAACGVMADGRPYTGLRGKEMQGNYGPGSVMTSALGAYTPNIPWPVFGCRDLIRMNGAGTSSATPQVAAAAALWFEKYKSILPRDWRRVEAVRHALFTSAAGGKGSKLGNGILQASGALGVRPKFPPEPTKSDRDSFAFFRVLTGLGLVEAPTREQMFDLEIMQRWLLNEDLQKLLDHPDDAPSPALVPGPEGAKAREQLGMVMEALIEDPGASLALRQHLVRRYPTVTGRTARKEEWPTEVAPPTLPAAEVPPAPEEGKEPEAVAPEPPPSRRLRVYALDPSLSGRLETAGIDTAVLDVRWEALEPGPTGEYLSVVDRDPTGQVYPGVDLNHPNVLAADGWAPSEGNPPFHQQMAYAVAMKTVEHFERALGRPVLWRERPTEKEEDPANGFVPRLTIRPHGVRGRNAYYSPAERALAFGYFEAEPGDPGELVPGSRIYTCLSHDIIAHETAHAVLDGMHRRLTVPSNPDVLAFHEGFSDIIALMQHFSMPELLRQELARARGDLETETLLGGLAVQFGRAVGREGALRNAIGRMEDGEWRRLEPDPAAMRTELAPHARGAILVAAVFDAFLAIYRARTADLLRIATGGTGVLPEGALHPDLVDRLASEAVMAASHVLTICIRALDYLPPVDITFFEYLRALVTADHDHVRSDRFNYRVSFVEAFRRRGIYPIELGRAGEDVPRSISVATLRWHGFDIRWASGKEKTAAEEVHRDMVKALRAHSDACTYVAGRKGLYEEMVRARRALADLLEEALTEVPGLGTELGIDPGQPFEVDEVRRAMRTGPDGAYAPQAIVLLTQTVQATVGDRTLPFQGGSTVVVDLREGRIAYRIRKRVTSERRRERTAEFRVRMEEDPLRGLFMGGTGEEPFQFLHALADEGRG